MSCRPISLPAALGLLLLTALPLAGCGGPRTVPAPVPPPVPGYENLRETFGPRDFTPLTGRRIVIDPGHGGFFRGATGPEGLTEADVNLGVSLYLRGLLEWAGAAVYLTRTADYDFLTPADSTLSFDLAFRVSLSDSLQPDVFLSIHHNSTASKDPTINETQTYYPVGDDGASLDLARSIHRHLALNLDIRPARILPGNFHVLRNATVPAVLGEPAMISNPVMEGRLSLAASHELEAQAYFLGLLDYFSAGTPVWAGAARDTVTYPAQGPVPTLSWTFEPGTTCTGCPAPDPGSFTLLQDGQPVPFALSADGRTVHWSPDRQAPRGSTFRITGRNLRGRATPLRETVLMRDSARVLYLQAVTDPESAGTFLLTWSTADGQPLPAGTLDLDGTAVPLAGGRDRGCVIVPLDDLPAAPTFTADGPSGGWDITAGPTFALDQRGQWRRLEAAGDHPWQKRTTRPGTIPGPLYVFHTEEDLRLERPGVLPLVRTDQGATLDTEDRIWEGRPLLPGLQGKRVVIDPAGGGSDPQGLGPLGSRGADVNLAVARQLKRLLRGAGARVHLTRTGDLAPDAPTKVRRATAQGADLFLTVSRSDPGAPLTIRHHYGSIAGERWADLQAAAAAALADSVLVEPSYAYLLRHTACPALEVALPAPVSGGDELRLEDPAWQMAEARALLLAIAATWDDPSILSTAVDPAGLIAGLPGAPEPGAVDWARLDGNFDWMPPRAGPGASGATGAHVVHSGYETGWPFRAGVHTLEIHVGETWQLWLLPADGRPLILQESP